MVVTLHVDHGAAVAPHDSISSRGRAKVMSLNSQGDTEGLKDGREGGSSRDILDKVIERLEASMTEAMYNVNATDEGGGSRVSKSLKRTCCGERLAIWSGNYHVDIVESDKDVISEGGYVLWNLPKNKPFVDVSLKKRAEAFIVLVSDSYKF